MPPEKILIPTISGVPSRVLYKSRIAAQIHSHRLSADWTVRDQRGRDLHIPLLCKHPPDNPFIVIGLVMAGPGTLPQAIIALRVEQPLLVKTRQLELMVHIGRKHEIIRIFHKLQQCTVRFAYAGFVPVHHYLPAPPRPVFLQGIIRIKTAGIHVLNTVFLMKIRKCLFKALAVIGHFGDVDIPAPAPMTMASAVFSSCFSFLIRSE